MDQRRWQLVRELFEQALDQPVAERGAWVRAQAGDDADLCAAVARLLEADAAPTPGLDPPAATLLEPPPSAAVHFDPGQSIGPYAVRTRIAAGGMGDVYLAHQERPGRDVAVKVLRADRPSDRSLRRFEREAEILARLDHPAIAKVLEAGHQAVPGTDSIVPWFAMEFVRDARHLLDHAEAEGLDLRQRCELLLAVCDAVQFAHEQGVIHRDIKPSNLLVDAAGQPKIIDFGIARDAEAGKLAATLTGEVLGTIGYMSPERISGARGGADARSDVYSLGVVLYQLCTGEPPLDLSGLPLAQAAETVRTAEPRLPSRIRPGVPLELDWIALRAVATDRQRRYPTVSELAADLRRFLAGEPVLAGAPSAAYRVKHFLRRHRTKVAIAGVLALGLFATAYGTGVGLERARNESAFSASMQSVFDAVLAEGDATVAGRDVRVSDLLRRMAATFPRVLAQHPDAAVPLHRSTAGAWFTLGELDEARAHVEDGLALADSGRGTPLERARLELLAARLHEANGDDGAAAVGFARAGGLASELAGDEARETVAEALAREAVARHALGETEQAWACIDRSIAMGEELDAPRLLAFAHWVRGQLARRQHDLQAALADYDAGLAALDGHAGEDARDVYTRLTLLQDKTQLLSRMGRHAEALALAETTLGQAQDWLGPLHPDLFDYRSRVATYRWNVGDREGAAADLEEALDWARFVTVPDLVLAHTKGNLVQFYAGLGRAEQALEILDPLIEEFQSMPGAEPLGTLQYRMMRANILFALGRDEEGIATYEATIADMDATVDDPYHAANARGRLATRLYLTNRSERALPWAERSLRDLTAILPADHPDCWSAAKLYAVLLHNTGRADEAAEVARRMAEGLDAERFPKRAAEMQALERELGL